MSGELKTAAGLKAVGVALFVAVSMTACGAGVKSKKIQDAATQAVQSDAREVLTAFAAEGDAGAQLDLALTLMDTDPASAKQWLEKAAMMGNGRAAYELGLLLDDPQYALEWFSMASAMGHVGARYQMGEAYLNGNGTAKEPGWGLMWLERAARAGNCDAQYVWATAMLTGKTAQVRPQEALKWLMIAEDGGVSAATPLIEQLKADLMALTIETIEGYAEGYRGKLAAPQVGDRASIRFAQYALSKLGYKPGSIDGIDGEKTYTALVAFRRAEGLGNGGLSTAVMDRLREKLARR
ncbi:SEL1-like repeat protein [Magnetovibrio sp. PR-2]|uniref:SEL1-like repeat protein n=1 Tax=Magnetovibrio sp. PR-2 TaxID=3120356 RepID=UPI002FCE67BF